VYLQPSCTLNWGPGMIDEDPLFVDAINDDFHIPYTSPCCDTGDSDAPGLPEEDFEGDPRVAYATVDMGADECYTHFYYTGEATPGGTVEIKLVGDPGAVPVIIWVGSDYLDDPIWTQYGDWYLEFPLITEINLGLMPSPGGVLVIPVDIPVGYPTVELPIQSLIGSKLTNLCVMSVE